tara:strand:- start:332 stop:619 length:288 start_codon:yes stop_codon:yes gene_type:complete
MRALSDGQRVKVVRALEQHKSFSNAYFWTPAGNRQQRDRWEDANTWSVKFKHEGVRYSYASTLRCSGANVYYKGHFSADGERVTVRRFKQLVGQS